MNARRALVGVTAAALLAVGIFVAPVGAGVQAPRDMIATPNTGPVGTLVTISNAANSPCGGEQGDGPAQVELTITRPDTSTDEGSVEADESGNWEIGYLETDLVGSYVVQAYCGDLVEPRANATDFTYGQVTFVITAAEPTTSTTTAAPPTTAAPAPAVEATAQFTG